MPEQASGGIWVRPRVEETEPHTTGAIDDTFTILDSAKLVKVHINFSATPDAEPIVVTMKNAAGISVATYTFDPTVTHPSENEITLVHLGWHWAGSGELNVTYDNTSENVTAVVACWEYDGA